MLIALLLVASLALARVAVAGDLDRVVPFNIPAESLDRALVEFGAQAHVQIMFAWHSQLARLRTQELKGRFTAREALAVLLRSTPLGFVEHGSTIQVVPRNRAGGLDPEGGPRVSGPRAADPTRSPEGPQETSRDGQPSAGGKDHAVVQLQTITVTGTHIAGVPLSSPLITISGDEINRSGYASIGDLIRSIPENFGGGNNPQVMIGSAPGGDNISFSGGSAPNLRGLGSGSTLSLVNGHRLAADSPTGAVDLSLIPLAVIDHVDVLTDGASAVYGSDAVAGVVNIVLKKDFNGAKTTLLGGGTADGGATERYFNQMLGKDWSTGDVLFDYEFDKLDPIFASQRAYSKTAAAPTTLVPGTSRNSFFLSAHQTISAGLSAFVDALYTYRISRDAISNYVAPVVYQSETEAGVHQYAVATGLNAALPAAWQFSAVGSLSQQRTIYQSTEQPGGPFPAIKLQGQTRYVEGSATGPAFDLPSGTVRGAVGGGYRLETYSETMGGVSEVGATARNVKYAYGEASVPLLPASDAPWRRALLLDASARYEHYSDVGNESMPKLGLVYEPFSTIKLRGTWGKAFRAPPLFDVYSTNGLLYIPLSDPSAATRRTDALVTTGGNRELQPERARTWTLGVDYDSRRVKGLSTSLTYFDVSYRNRIARIANFFTALTDPLNAPFVVRAPSAAFVQSLLDSAGSNVRNITGSPLEAGDVPVVVNETYVNVASQDLSGFDLNVRYHRTLPFADVEPFVNGTLLDLRQRLVPQAPEAEISGQTFQPPKARVRAGTVLIHGRWSVTGLVNYSGAEVNTYLPSQPHVASWTTVDFDIALRPQSGAAASGLALNLSVENAFNRDPPFVQFDQFVPGLHYDPLNASVSGRVVRVSASWVFR